MKARGGPARAEGQAPGGRRDVRLAHTLTDAPPKFTGDGASSQRTRPKSSVVPQSRVPAGKRLA